MSVLPSPFVLEHAPWSTSKADVAKQCPYKFHLQYIKKVKTPYAVGRPARIGKAVHTAMEYALRGAPVEQAFKIALEMHGLVTDEVDTVNDYKPAAKKFMVDFRAYTKCHKALPPDIELKLGVDLKGNPTKFFDNENCFLRGVVDLCVRFSGKPAILIVDHKTGKQHDISYYTQQFAAYQLLLRAKYPELEEAYIGLNFIAEDNVVLNPTPYPVKDIEPLMDSIVQFLNDATAETQNFDVKRRSPLCDWCEYKKSGDCLA